MGRVIDAYLDELFDRLAGTGAAGRRSLAKAEDHLRAAADEAIDRGVEPTVASVPPLTVSVPPAESRAGSRLSTTDRRYCCREPSSAAGWSGR